MSPATPDHTEIALPRSCSGKMLPSTESVDGIVHAPPTPIAPRAMASQAAVVANAAVADATPKITSPIMSRPLRPRRSPMTASGRSRPGEHEAVRTADPLQTGLVGVQPRSMLGNATARIVLSITTIDRQRHSTPSARQRRGYPPG